MSDLLVGGKVTPDRSVSEDGTIVERALTHKKTRREPVAWSDHTQKIRNPAVVGVKNATKVIKDGETIIVHGFKGLV